MANVGDTGSWNSTPATVEQVSGTGATQLLLLQIQVPPVLRWVPVAQFLDGTAPLPSPAAVPGAPPAPGTHPPIPPGPARPGR